VESFISDPPFPGRFTYIPVIKDVTELVTADMLRDADFSFDVQDHNLYVVTPYLQGGVDRPAARHGLRLRRDPGNARTPSRPIACSPGLEAAGGQPPDGQVAGTPVPHGDLSPAADEPSIRAGRPRI
jgi:hypothetical protein